MQMTPEKRDSPEPTARKIMMLKLNSIKRRCFRAMLMLCICVSAHVALAQDTFDNQRATVSASPATQSEDAIISLLETGIAESKPTQAIALTRLWLRENVAQEPLLLYRAAQAAELSGDWRGAAAIYQQYLKRADLKSESAADALYAVNILLLDQLGDVESAYAFMANEGHRLHVCDRARQFDTWFLDTAMGRRDHEAVAERLLACVDDANMSDDLLVARYDVYFRWLLSEIAGWRMDHSRFPAGFTANVKALAKGITFDDKLKLRLDWSVSVKQYNMNLLDGNEALLPIVEATALLQKYPRYAELVQTGWAERRGRYYKDDPKKYWPIDVDAKLAPIKVAAAKLGPLQQADFYQSWESRYYDSGPQVLSVEETRAFVLANPKVVNSKSGPSLELGWTTLTFEEASKLAPHLEQNSTPEASLIRAIAVGGEEKDFDKALAALLGPEAWRLPQHRDQRNVRFAAFHKYFAAPTAPEASKKWGELAGGLATVDARKEDSATLRIAAFGKLWSDFRSPQPKLPSVFERLKKVLAFTPEIIPELLKDDSPIAQMLVRDAISKGFDGLVESRGRGLSPYRYDPSILRIAHYNHGMEWLREHGKDLYRPHPFEPALRTTIAARLKQGKVQSWLVMAWINAQFPENNDESVALMAALFKSPVFKTLPFEMRYASRQWFKDTAMTPEQFAFVTASDPRLACKDLLALMQPPADWKPTMPAGAEPDPKAPVYKPDVAKTVAALSAAIEGVQKAPVRMEILGLAQLAAVDDAVFTDPKVMELLLRMAGPMRTFHREGYDRTYGERFWQYYLSTMSHPASPQDPLPGTSISARPTGLLLHQTSAYFWHHTELHHHSLQPMIAFAETLAETDSSAASTWARCGLQTIARHRHGHTYYNRETDIPRLKSIRGKAALAMGLIEVPVPASDPTYPIYKSQAEFAIGNEDSALELYDENADQLLPVHRDLSVPYLLWVLQRTIDGRDELRQEELVKALMLWSQESTTAFSAEQKLALEIAYGDIAMQRGMLPEAHKIYAGIQKNENYAGILARHTATLRRVRIERISKDFDAALTTLVELESEKIPQLTTAAHHARAEVYYDMEEYEDAADEIAKVLERDATHSDATILRGRVQLKLKRLIEATEIELGSATRQASLVPGEVLKVTLNDPTLSVSSGGSEIEVVVWATSGDKEHLLLRQFGDEKTKYRGEVRTSLGKAESGDQTLQVVGDDEIFYAYSERFRAKVTNLGENRGGPIIVASDAVLMASARKLLTENEQRVADMESVTAALDNKGITNLANTDPDVIAALKAEANAAARKRALQTRVKPGNPIHLRVIDPDRGRTAEIDELPVTVVSSSGDSLGRIVLRETGTHTGQFEGSVPTSRAQAMAVGSTSETGRNPNMIISPNNTYDAWRPVSARNAQHSFMVDLNDNASLGSLEIEASDAGFGLKSFLVQTAMNPGRWTTVGRSKLDLHPIPKAEGLPASIAIPKVWHPSIIVMSDTDRYQMGARPTVNALQELEHHLEQGWLTQQFPQGIAQNVAGPSNAMPAAVPTALKWKRHRAHDCPHVVYRFRGWFYEHADVTRHFRLTLGRHEIPENTHPSLSSAPKFMLAVDGRPITPTTKPEEEEFQATGGKLEGEINLRAGLHRFEIWGIGWVQTTFGFGRTTQLEANLDGDDELVACPDTFFDPTRFPDGAPEHRNAPATLIPNADGTKFTVNFAEGSRARLLRLVFASNEGPVPSLNRLKLTTPEGDTLLPVPQDFAELRKNELLEILSGDKVTVRYLDDRYVTKGKQKHERFLNVSYSDGRIEFADIEPRFSNRHGEKMPNYERLLRFQHGKPFPVVIRDADMDVSVEPDEVTFRATDGDGNELQFVAQETGASTGTFRAFVTPTAKKASAPNEIYVPADSKLIVAYRDAENHRPGVPYDRTAACPSASFRTPTIEVAHMTVERVVPEGTDPAEELHADFVPDLEGRNASAREQAIMERIRSRYEIQQTFVDTKNAGEDGIEVVHGRAALIDVIAPHVALSTTATIDLFVQTDAGRKISGGSPDGSFDVDVPGTLRISAELGKAPRIHPGMLRAGYRIVATEGESLSLARSAEQRIRDYAQAGRFRVAVPLIAGILPKYSCADPEAVRELKLPQQYGLTVRSGERIHIGVRFKDDAGKMQWVTSSAKVITHPMLDVMTEGFRRPLTKAFVGEKVHLRVIDLAADRTDGRDTVRCYMASKSDQKHYVYLRETDTHTGIFKGSYQLTYISENASNGDSNAGNGDADKTTEYDVRRLGFPVIYGDTVGIRYTDASGGKTPPQFVTVGKGSDGTIAPFSKQYEDSEMAMHTQFAMAESYLELARRHRTTGEVEQADREFTRAKQLLANAVNQFTDLETRSHAEYLLGGLTQEDAEATTDPELRKRRYQAALARFMTITGSYGETEYASKAQFKIALIYEALDEPEIAAQEFVKLAYKYPESEYLATAMARLGTHFQRKAVAYEREAAPLLAKAEADPDNKDPDNKDPDNKDPDNKDPDNKDPDNKDAEHQGTALKKLSHIEYVKAAQIFERLQTRFPDHELAGKAGLRAGQIYMRADRFNDAIKALMNIVNDEAYNGPTLRSEAMYWAARCHESLNGQLQAYALYKRITYDFPESKWAAYARGQLSTERLLRLDRDLELKRLQEGQE
ncbi:MAG: TolA-binding protein [Pirellulaceae bacterium]|jgi:TolA-binding protein